MKNNVNDIIPSIIPAVPIPFPPFFLPIAPNIIANTAQTKFNIPCSNKHKTAAIPNINEAILKPGFSSSIISACFTVSFLSSFVSSVIAIEVVSIGSSLLSSVISVSIISGSFFATGSPQF